MIRGQDLINKALEWRGARYIWGGDQRNPGPDCSGFIIGVLRELGQEFTHRFTAEAFRQYCSQIIDKSDCKTGDLVFFEKTYANPEEIDQFGPDHRIATHIAFVLEDGPLVRMLDANDARGNVGITNLSLAYWWPHFLEVRRLPFIGDDMDAVRSFIANALSEDGEVQTALREIKRNLEEDQNMDDALVNVNALADRVESLWGEWNG